MSNQYDDYWNSFLPVYFDRISAIIKKSMTEAVTSYGLTNAHASYLIALHLQDGQTLLELSRFLDLDPANTNRVIKVLREKGLIYDDRVSEKSKKFHVFLTDEGRKIAEETMQYTSKILNEPFKDIPYQDLMTVRKVLISTLSKLDPQLNTYMTGSLEWSNPFYSYLGFIPPYEDPRNALVMSRRINEKKPEH